MCVPDVHGTVFISCLNWGPLIEELVLYVSNVMRLQYIYIYFRCACVGGWRKKTDHCCRDDILFDIIFMLSVYIATSLARLTHSSLAVLRSFSSFIARSSASRFRLSPIALSRRNNRVRPGGGGGWLGNPQSPGHRSTRSLPVTMSSAVQYSNFGIYAELMQGNLNRVFPEVGMIIKKIRTNWRHVALSKENSPQLEDNVYTRQKHTLEQGNSFGILA